MTENALSIYQQFGQLQQAAGALYKSGYFVDAKSEAQAMVKVMAGAELGLPPFAAMTGIHIIQGKPALGANVIATLIKNDLRYDYRVLELSDAICRIEFYEHGKPCGVSEFTIADAKKAQTKNLDKFPKNMLFARAISNGAKWYTPGIFGGAPIYTPEELGAEVDEDGVILEGSYTPAPAPVQRQPEPEPQPKANSNGRKSAPAEVEAVALPDDEQVIVETPAAGFFDAVTVLINRYENVHAAKSVAKKLGFAAIPKEIGGRLDMYRAIKAYAAERDAEEAAEAQAANNELFPIDEAINGAYQD